ncbi:MAG: hypothetical protein WCG81_05035 [Candidatus Angelobacter sp.]
MMKIPLLKGRVFNVQDKFGEDPVIVVSDSLAKQIFPNQDPVGKQLYLFDAPTQDHRRGFRCSFEPLSSAAAHHLFAASPKSSSQYELLGESPG